MGSVTSYDVTKSRKTRRQLPTFDSDEIASDYNEMDNSEDEEEHTENSSSTQRTRNSVNRNCQMQTMSSHPEIKLPKPKPRSVRTRTSIGTSSNVSSSKSNTSNSATNLSATKENNPGVDISNKSSIPSSPHLTSLTRMDESNQPMLDSVTSNSIGVDLIPTKHNEKQRTDDTKVKMGNTSTKRKESVPNGKDIISDPVISKDIGRNGDANTIGQLGRSKSSVQLDVIDNSNPSVR